MERVEARNAEKREGKAKEFIKKNGGIFIARNPAEKRGRLPPSVAKQVKGLLNEITDNRRLALHALNENGDFSSAPYIAHLLVHDPKPSVREEAAMALARVAGATAAGHLIYAMNEDPDHLVRQTSAHSLAKAGLTAEEMVKHLKTALKKEKHEQTRQKLKELINPKR